MRYTFETEESFEARRIVGIHDLYGGIEDFSSWLRSQCKHVDQPADAYQIREMFGELVGVHLHE